jgi:hypothetical protein
VVIDREIARVRCWFEFQIHRRFSEAPLLSRAVWKKPGPQEAEIEFGFIIWISITRFQARIDHFSAQSLR